MTKKDDKMNIAIGLAGIAAMIILSKSNDGSGGSGGSLSIPADAVGEASIQPESVPQSSPIVQSFIPPMPEWSISNYSKKEISSGQFTSPITGMQASSIFSLSDWGSYAAATEKATGAYPRSPANSPSRDQMANEYFARVAAYENSKKVATSTPSAGVNVVLSAGQSLSNFRYSGGGSSSNSSSKKSSSDSGNSAGSSSSLHSRMGVR